MKIIVRDAQEPDCDQLAEAVKEYMTEQQKTLEQRLGNHQLTLLSDTGATVADANLRNLQRNSVNDLATLATAGRKCEGKSYRRTAAVLRLIDMGRE